MMMHNGPSGVLSSCDSLIDLIDSSNNPMVKHHLSDSQEYHQREQQQSQQQHYYSHPHSDSSRSSSICSTSLSPKTSSPTTALAISSGASVPSTTTTAALNDVDPILAQHVEYELGLAKKNVSGTGSGTRKNAWGNLSYAELIAKAIASSAEQRLTLSEIYDWMIKYVPFFRNKVDRISSAGWKNSIRHNLSLHNRFKRVQSEGTGKSSWWMLNPDDKGANGNGTTSSPSSSSTSNGVKQVRRRLGQTSKSSSLSSTNPTPKRLRAQRSTKVSRVLTNVDRLEQQQYHRNALNQDIPSSEMSIASVYEAQPWPSQLETENVANHLYDQELYVTSVNTPPSKSNGNSTGCIQSTYPYDEIPPNYIANISSNNRTNNNNNNNTGDYSYHQTHHFHPHPSHHSHTLYQHHHGSNYDTNSPSGGYYHHPHHLHQPVLNDHHSDPCTFPIDTYHRTNPNSYSLQQQQQQQQTMDLNDEHIYLNVHSASSHSSTSSHSPPTLSINNNKNLLPSRSSGSTNYLHSQKSLSTGGYIHPTSNESITLYSHHHQHLSRHPHIQHPDIEAVLQLRADDDDINDDDEDFSTLVHHHSMIDDQEQLSSFIPNNNHNHPLHSYHDTSPSILRTVLKRPIVDVYNQQV